MPDYGPRRFPSTDGESKKRNARRRRRPGKDASASKHVRNRPRRFSRKSATHWTCSVPIRDASRTEKPVVSRLVSGSESLLLVVGGSDRVGQRDATATMDHSDREPLKDVASHEKRRDKHPLSNAFSPKAPRGDVLGCRRLLSSAFGKPPTVNKINPPSYDVEKTLQFQ